MAERYYVVKQNREGCYLLNEPNKIILETDSFDEALEKYKSIAKDTHFYYELNKGVYVLCSTGHYSNSKVTSDKTLYVYHQNTYPF